MICTVGLCWIDVIRNIGNGAQIGFTSNLIGVCVFPMIVMRFKAKDFLKLPNLLWLILFAILAYPAYRAMDIGTDYNGQIASAILNIGLYGLVLIRMLHYLFKEHKENLKKMSPVFWLWSGLLVFCIISRNEAIWPLWFAVMMGAFYLAPADRKTYEDTILGIVDGVIVSFVWIQSRAFLYRPYDVYPAYRGHFNNSSVNSMFYLYVYMAVLVRLAYAVRRQKKSKLECALLFILACSMWDFAYLTASRSALLAYAVITIVYLVAEKIKTKNGSIKKFMISGLSMFLVFVLMFVPVYACVRYIPALRHHPVWYGDYSEDKVHSWDPIDSEKYVTLEEALGKVLIDKIKKSLSVSYIVKPYFIVCSVVKWTDMPGGQYVYEYSDGVEPGTDLHHKVFIVESRPENIQYGYEHMGFLGNRRYVYKFFIEHLNLMGHKPVHQYFYIDDIIGHAHNSYLQISYYFGIIAGLFFLALSIYGPVYIFRKRWNGEVKDRWVYLYPLLFLTGYFTFSIFECPTFLGEYLFTGFFLCLLPIMRKEM